MKRPPNHGPWGRRDPENSQGDDHPEWGLPGERKSSLGCAILGLVALLAWCAVVCLAALGIGHALGWW